MGLRAGGRYDEAFPDKVCRFIRFLMKRFANEKNGRIVETPRDPGGSSGAMRDKEASARLLAQENAAADRGRPRER
jgi:hypothetical protein